MRKGRLSVTLINDCSSRDPSACVGLIFWLRRLIQSILGQRSAHGNARKSVRATTCRGDWYAAAYIPAFSFPQESTISFLVVRAENLPDIHRSLRMKRRFFVTVTYQATTRKSASVKIDRQWVEWNEKLDPLWDTSF